ncbi:MAG: hypothetical protein ABR551_14235 [Gemmatimonadales bacterium]
MIWEQGHRQVSGEVFAAWLAAYPRPLAPRVHESRDGFLLHLYLDDTLRDARGEARCVASVQPSGDPRLGPTYRIHGEAMQREVAA